MGQLFSRLQQRPPVAAPAIAPTCTTPNTHSPRAANGGRAGGRQASDLSIRPRGLIPANDDITPNEITLIQPDSPDELHNYCKHSSSPDPYQNSPAYYLMTGRKGLWFYHGDFEKVVLCQHPNLESKLIIFPPRENAGWQDIAKFMDTHGQNYQSMRIARVSADQADDISSKLNTKSQKYQFNAVIEDVLDFKFAVHTLDTQRLVSKTGPGLKEFRRFLRRVESTDITVKDIDFENCKEAYQAVIASWRQIKNLDQDDSSYCAYLIEQLGKHLNLKGQIIDHQNKPCGLVIWEMPVSGHKIANALVTVTSRTPSGISEYIHWLMAKALTENNVSRVCIGGSETPGLDQFKRKFDPVQSIELMSIQCVLRND
jgi:hypothetical protein